VGALGLLALPSVAAAQTPPADPDEPAAPGAPAAAGAAAGGTTYDVVPRWTLRLGVLESWDSAPLDVGSELATHFIGRLRAGLTHARGGRRAQWMLAGNVSTLFDQATFSLDRLAYDATLQGTAQAGTRARLILADTLHTDYSDRSPLLIEEGTVLPLVLTRENSARFSADYRLSQRTSLTAELRHDLVGFDSDGLVDRSTGTANAHLRRQVGRAQELSLDYMFQVRDAEGTRGTAQRFAGGWSATGHGGRQTIALSGGLERFERLDGDGALNSPWGSVDLALRRPRGTFSLAYEHAVVASYEDVSDRVADTVSLAFSTTLARRLTGTLGTSLSRRRDPETDGPAEDMARASAGVSLLTQSGLELSARYAFESRRRAEIIPWSSRHRVEVDLGFGRVWH
jgi:hypothetical protein